MLVSLNWLKRYVPLTQSVSELEVALTSLGLEVEGIQDQGQTYSSLIVGKVLEYEPHPDSDHLSVTKVFDGTEQVQVVCGAPNVAKGQTVAFAPVGTELPMPDGKSLKLKKMKLRGIESCGMICAEDEIGLSANHDGIMILDDALQAGTTLQSLGFYDVIFELGITPNRPDALNHIGVARELAAHFKLPLQLPSVSQLLAQAVQARKELVLHSKPACPEQIQLQVQPDCGCTKYAGKIIRGVTVQESPAWLQRLLTAVNITPVNNVVDITNFVLMEWGQPLHSFDLDLLQSGVVAVRNAKQGEQLETLDHTKRDLVADDLIICNGGAPACVAGVMGGVDTEISNTSQNIFLESAWFNPVTIRKQARRLGLSSDSSYRFERGIDPFMQEDVCEYAAALIASLCGGQVADGAVVYTAPNHKSQLTQIALRPQRVAKVLGMSIAASAIENMLTGIGLTLMGTQEASSSDPSNQSNQSEQSDQVAQSEQSDQGAQSLVFSVPGYRPDLEREIDLIEEVSRIVGLNEVPMILPAFKPQLNPLPPFEVLGRKVRYALLEQGLHECVSLRFSKIKTCQTLFTAQDPRANPVPLLNPLNEEWGAMPTSLVPGLLKALQENEKNRASSVRLFELAKAFFDQKSLRNEKHPGIYEQQLLSGLVAGEWDSLPYATKAQTVDFGVIKGLVQNTLKRLGLHIQCTVPVDGVVEISQAQAIHMPAVQPFLHPGVQATVLCNGVALGFMGQLHPAIAKEFGIVNDAFIFELDFDKIMTLAAQNKPVYKPFSRFGAVTRDISFYVPVHITHQQIMDVFAKCKARNLLGIELKNTYQNEKIGKDRKNMVYQCVYQHSEKTLTDEEVNTAQEKLRKQLLQQEFIELV
jgi:phenylalanyl-tRNA synthetase beta chain